MPYISNERREALNEAILVGSEGTASDPQNAGELNYAFTRIAAEYLGRRGLSYQHLNDVIGALEGAKLELYRRVAAPYEDTKIAANGDVFTPYLRTAGGTR